MNTFYRTDVPVPVDFGPDGDGRVDARELHAFLAVRRDFTTWIKGRIDQYGFARGVDYEVFDSPDLGNQNGRGGDRRSQIYSISVEMAKELALVENNERGRFLRRHFIQAEKKYRKAVAEGVLLTREAAHTVSLFGGLHSTLIYASRSVVQDLRKRSSSKAVNDERKWRDFKRLSRTQPPLKDVEIARILGVSVSGVKSYRDLAAACALAEDRKRPLLEGLQHELKVAQHELF